MHPVNTQLRLSERDEQMHPVETAKNFNESMYFNLFDHEQKIGGWFRLGNRPNEGHAEMSCCLYLPGGRIGFMYQRPELRSNDSFDAAGMKFEIVEPFQRQHVTYKGMLCVLSEPQQMEDPRKAFTSNPICPCEVSLDFNGIAPPFGGEPVDTNGKPIEIDPETAFARGHYEQHLAGQGSIKIGSEVFTLNGFGLRDHSWGPRYWQNIHWYRWLPLVFNKELAMMLSIVTRKDGTRTSWGVVMSRDAQGNARNDGVTQIDLRSDYDKHRQAIAQTAHIKTESGATFELSGKGLSLIPLRNRRVDSNGNDLHTRITDALTEFRCNGQTGYGMAEYLDQIVDGQPAGFPA
jgi:hypothetical protein